HRSRPAADAHVCGRTPGWPACAPRPPGGRAMTSRLFAGALLLAAGVSVSAADSTPSFSKDVAPILYQHCVECHRAGEAAPMSLTTYQEARPWAKAIKQAVLQHVMPPWRADPRYGAFSNQRGLAERE